MPIRFYRRIKIAPGVKLNLSKSGLSTTVGPRGIHFTFGKRGIRRSIGIPGTGLSEVDYIKKNETAAEQEKGEGAEEQRQERVAEKREPGKHARAAALEPAHESRHNADRRAMNPAPAGLRNAFVLLGVVVFFFAGAAVLGLMPAHFLSNSLQYVAHLVQSTGH